MARPARLTDEQQARARALYLADKSMTIHRLARAYGVGYTVMQRVLAPVARPTRVKVGA